MTESTRVRIDDHELVLTNLEKVLYPAAGFTKGAVIDYYARIGARMVPHLDRRAITMVRWPDGVDAEPFYEKRCPAHAPPWIHTGGPQDNVIVDSTAALVWTANLAALELHVLRATVDEPERPLDCVIDLDPGAPATVRECCQVALVLRDVLAQVGLMAFAKTSGSKGLHLSIPLHTAVTHDDTKAFALALGSLLADSDLPVVVDMRKARRAGKVFVDWSQNDQAKTTIAPYSMRGGPQPTVSTPITWDEVHAGAAGATDLVFTAGAVLERVERLGDLWADTGTLHQELPRR